jgi:hypothetical protein
MSTQAVYGICGICIVRCPMIVGVKSGELEFQQGNPHGPAM